ncbi:MAG TPA: SOS response-associated peptidase [Gemmatimonadaceae bacterium]|nr:SOS response-associated peptidase [Gemmatimonadaceae bacterium]
MCGRATVVNPDGITEKLYGFTKKFVPSDWKPRYNLNPREEIPAVYYDPFLKERVLRTMHWNLIPSKLANRNKVAEFDSHYSAFNARIETVASAPTFEQAWRSQRCLVVVDGIIEWVGEKRHKIPHLIRHRERKPLAMAGLWSRWRDGRDGEEIWSCAVVVKDADDWYRRFHNRMAMLLAPEACERWLEGGKQEEGSGKRDFATFAYDELEFFPISKLVNNIRNDSPEVLEPTVYPDPEPSIELLLDL